MGFSFPTVFVFAVLVLPLTLVGCASSQPRPTSVADSDALPSVDAKGDVKGEKNDQLSKLQEKIQDLEIRLNALNDKVNIENGAPDKATKASPVSSEEAVHVPAAHARVIPKSEHEKSKKEADFVQDEAVDRYREAKILFDSKRYSDAILEFSSFVKNYPEHILAPSAQYYLGVGYAAQSENKLAEEELNRGLIAYPHSNAVPDTLLALAEISERLKKPARVTYYKQKLLSAFPNSPQAKEVSLESAPSHAKAETPAENEVKKEVVEKTAEKNLEIEKPEAPTAPEAPSMPTSEAGDH